MYGVTYQITVTFVFTTMGTSKLTAIELLLLLLVTIMVKVKQSRYRPGVAQRVPGSSVSQIT
jgi:hypothetical protein